MIYLDKEHAQKIKKYCQKEYPKEACGILAGKEGMVEKIYRMQNISETPLMRYFMKPEEQLKVFKTMRADGEELVAIYHSHSASRAYPSETDEELAFYPDAVYLIISLQNFNKPVFRGFKITGNGIEEEEIAIRKNILFVCVENSCRSQVAEAMVNNLYRRKFAAYSAGSKHSVAVNPSAVEVMKEIGIDISGQKSKGFDAVKDMEFDYVVTMGCGDACPVYPAALRLDWQIDDPKGKTLNFFRNARDEIQRKIQELSVCRKKQK